MTQTAEGFVQVSPDSIGKKIRNLVLANVLQPDGSTAQVYMQVVVLFDPVTGQPLNLLTQSDLEETNRLLRAVVRGLEILTDEELNANESDT